MKFLRCRNFLHDTGKKFATRSLPAAGREFLTPLKTAIRFDVGVSGNVSLKVYGVPGRELAVLADENFGTIRSSNDLHPSGMRDAFCS